MRTGNIYWFFCLLSNLMQSSSNTRYFHVLYSILSLSRDSPISLCPFPISCPVFPPLPALWLYYFSSKSCFPSSFSLPPKCPVFLPLSALFLLPVLSSLLSLFWHPLLSLCPLPVLYPACISFSLFHYSHIYMCPLHPLCLVSSIREWTSWSAFLVLDFNCTKVDNPCSDRKVVIIIVSGTRALKEIASYSGKASKLIQ